MATPSRRARAREVVLQLLYQDDLNPQNNPALGQQFIKEELPDATLRRFAEELLRGVRRNRSELDRRIASVAENWSLDRMAGTDRNVLRLAAYELLYTSTPERVVIDQAVELAKKFGTDQSSGFVNGVLDRMIKKKGKQKNPSTS
ncbi:MAG: transcription antitermination factor NusB [Planctomycetota bacterium]|nr:MAG: transcription antitermination factor NusB [Planctomycetota bacterium]